MANYYFNPARYHHPVQYPINGGGWNNYPYTQIPTTTTKATPQAPKKVIQVPVQFVETLKARPRSRSVSISALKIQKVFRGFLVRKNVKRIVKIEEEVDEIEKRIGKEEVIDLICRDGKERLRLNEMLMGLLLKLDSIRGIDSGVRDCRKMVIKKAIMLQERLDSIVVEDQAIQMVNFEEKEEKENVVDQNREVNDHVELEPERDSGVFELQGLVESTGDGGEAMVEYPEKSQLETPEKYEFKAENECFELAKDVQEEDKVTELGEAMNVDNEDKHGGGGEEDRKDLMVRMIEGNEKLTGLVAELCERNEMQSRLISSLSQRVENLEKAWKSERLRRKKKRMDAITNATMCGRKS